MPATVAIKGSRPSVPLSRRAPTTTTTKKTPLRSGMPFLYMGSNCTYNACGTLLGITNARAHLRTLYFLLLFTFFLSCARTWPPTESSCSTDVCHVYSIVAASRPYGHPHHCSPRPPHAGAASFPVHAPTPFLVVSQSFGLPDR